MKFIGGFRSVLLSLALTALSVVPAWATFVIGVPTKDGWVIGADRRVMQGTTQFDDYKKLHAMKNGAIVAAAGTAALFADRKADGTWHRLFDAAAVCGHAYETHRNVSPRTLRYELIRAELQKQFNRFAWSEHGVAVPPSKSRVDDKFTTAIFEIDPRSKRCNLYTFVCYLNSRRQAVVTGKVIEGLELARAQIFGDANHIVDALTKKGRVPSDTSQSYRDFVVRPGKRVNVGATRASESVQQLLAWSARSQSSVSGDCDVLLIKLDGTLKPLRSDPINRDAKITTPLN